MEVQTGISVLIVNYNGEKYIEETINSLKKCLDLFKFEYEILIVDNNSSDNSVKTIQFAFSDDNNVILHSLHENSGFARGNNFLVKKAQYQYIMLINNDTRTLKIDCLLNLFSEGNICNDAVYTSVILNKDETIQQNVFGKPSVIKLFLELFLLKKMLKRVFSHNASSLSIKSSYFSGCFLFMSKKLFLKVGGFDERYTFYHEEADFFLKLGMDIKKIVLPDRIIHYGGGGNEMSDYAFSNYYLGLYKLFLYNKLVHKRVLKILFKLGVNYRCLLMKIGFKINYLPFDIYKNLKITRKTTEIIAVHKKILLQINDLIE